MRPAAASLLLTILLAGCAAPSPTTVSLALVPDRQVLMEGESVPFSVVATLGDGSSRTVPGAWQIAGVALARDDASGSLTGLSPGSATVVVTADGRRLERSFSVVDDLRGTWTGDLHTGCHRVKGAGPSWCSKFPAGVHRNTTFTVVVQTGGGASIDVTVEDVPGHFRGSVTADRSLGIESATLAWLSSHGTSHYYRFSNWNVRVTGHGSLRRLEGSCDLEYEMTNAWGLQVYQDPCTISLARL